MVTRSRKQVEVNPSISSKNEETKEKTTKMSRETKRENVCWKYTKQALKIVLILVLVPAVLNYSALRGEEKVFNRTGEMVDTGLGHQLYLNCKGDGVPTVILEAPTGMSSDVWVLVMEELSKTTKVCSYDRAGLGFSLEPVTDKDRMVSRSKPFTLESMTDDLHSILTKAPNLEPPFLLVGSEMGALIARFYSQMYESNVAGLVLIDPLVETVLKEDGDVWEHFWYKHLVPSYMALHMGSLTGLSRIAVILNLLSPPLLHEAVGEEVIARQKHLLCNYRHMSTVLSEHIFLNESLSQMRLAWKIKSFPKNLPVTVISGDVLDRELPSQLNEAWEKSLNHLLTKLHPGSKHVLLKGTDHHALYRNASSVSNSIKEVISSWRLLHLTADK